MADGEKQYHHLFHHKDDGPKDPEKELKHHQHLELLGGASALTAGAYALHEKHKAKKDPENAHHHKVGEEVAAAVEVGAAGFTFHEHHALRQFTIKATNPVRRLKWGFRRWTLEATNCRRLKCGPVDVIP